MGKLAELDADRQVIDRLSALPTLNRDRTSWTPADTLVDKFCSGQINEMEFASRGSIIGMPREEIDDLIRTVRAEDGGY